MDIILDLAQIKGPLRRPVLTIGNFDGVHRGHLALFTLVKEKARAIEGLSAVMTFEPHPIRVMKPGNGPLLITPTDQKLKLIADAGIDVILCLPFTKAFASISARDFVKDILVGRIGIRGLVVGYDYAFGQGREGNIQLLKEMGIELGFDVHEVGPVYAGNTLVASTSIRRFIQEGNLAEAKRLLGRDYQISGTVVEGKKRGGRLLGYPTANMKLVDTLTPKPGVYVVRVAVNDRTYDGLTNVGYNPTFGNGALSVETHILEFSGDLLGRKITVEFVERLRDEKTFGTAEDLAEQIRRDVIQARGLIAKRKA
jgi:riboflavin kinase/FMN adenylyltransferase